MRSWDSSALVALLVAEPESATHLGSSNRAAHGVLCELQATSAETLIAIVTKSTGPSTCSKKGRGSR